MRMKSFWLFAFFNFLHCQRFDRSGNWKKQCWLKAFSNGNSTPVIGLGTLKSKSEQTINHKQIRP